jgi:uncharacterized protein YkwD
MKAWHVLKTAAAIAAASALCFLFFVSLALAQDHSPNRPPNATRSNTLHPSADERFLLDAANRERSDAGLQPLRWDSALAEAARQHAEVMVSQNLLLHQCLNEAPLDERAAAAGAKFSMIAENIAVGPNAETIHNGWMHSTGHRKNILNADVTAIGISTMRGSGGLFAVQDFSRPVEALSLEQQEEKVISLLKSNGLQIADVSEDARKTCKRELGLDGPPALFVTRFEVTDLNKLPDSLLERVKSRAYRKAAVGACKGGETGGFTRYRLAVLLN